ncbi:dihydrofolate reductase family protein [Agromyces sp. LHK192]|uniref:dihydrofolate reductase family protein n=1 Tax=Agromyces sp. LHK192 TaxID=2498704 RepID=UPI000FDB3144|nr:dihydrofolate reductase family protein [Agromyces sp. LHK192]
MRELVYYVAVSLDGYIAAPDGRFDDFLFEGDHMEGINARYAETIPTDIAAAVGIERSDDPVFDTVLMGWNTYSVPGAPASPYRHLRQVVFSRTHADDDLGAPEHLEVTAEDPVEVVRRLKAEQGRAIWLCGGGELASALIGEIDRLVLKRQPLLFGAGIPLFAPGAYEPRLFTEVETTVYRTGVVFSEFERVRA